MTDLFLTLDLHFFFIFILVLLTSIIFYRGQANTLRTKLFLGIISLILFRKEVLAGQSESIFFEHRKKKLLKQFGRYERKSRIV